MRICLIGHHDDHPDEGVRNITLQLARELAKRHTVAKIDVNDVFGWLKVRAYRPDVMHFVLGPSSSLGFMVCKVYSLLYPSAGTVLSAVQPSFPPGMHWLMRLGPQIILAQSLASQKIFTGAGYKSVLLPGGVDINRFHPVSAINKSELRKKFGISEKKLVILHVGAINEGRNVSSLTALQHEGTQVIVVGRPSEKPYRQTLQRLFRAGVQVWTEYLPKIEEVYAIADCYVFPCTNMHSSVEIPLSVLEAMACNLPVVTMRFGGLPDIFIESGGFTFADDEVDMLRKVDGWRIQKPETTTRQQVERYSWASTMTQIEAVYAQITRR